MVSLVLVHRPDGSQEVGRGEGGVGEGVNCAEAASHYEHNREGHELMGSGPVPGEGKCAGAGRRQAHCSARREGKVTSDRARKSERAKPSSVAGALTSGRNSPFDRKNQAECCRMSRLGPTS